MAKRIGLGQIVFTHPRITYARMLTIYQRRDGSFFYRDLQTGKRQDLVERAACAPFVKGYAPK